MKLLQGEQKTRRRAATAQQKKIKTDCAKERSESRSSSQNTTVREQTTVSISELCGDSVPEVEFQSLVLGAVKIVARPLLNMAPAAPQTKMKSSVPQFTGRHFWQFPSMGPDLFRHPSSNFDKNLNCDGL